jgi:bacterioferritin-associated ferredoxin
MYVCICNRLSDSMIGEAVDHGARTPTDVFRHFRMRRGCSSCTVHVAEAIERAQDRTHSEISD